MMKKKLSVSLIAIGFGVLTTVIPGCAMNRVDLADTGRIKLVQGKMSKAYIVWSSAYEKDDGLVITGILRRHDHVGIPIRAHVDVYVVSPEGTILSEVRSSDVYVSRRITGRSCLGSERFTVNLPNMPAKESLIRVVSHSD